MRPDPTGTGWLKDKPLSPDQNEQSIAGRKRNLEKLAWFNSSPPTRDDNNPRRPVMRLDWECFMGGGRVMPIWKRSGHCGLEDLLDLLDEIREYPGGYDAETVAFEKHLRKLLDRARYEQVWDEVKLALDGWNAAPADQIVSMLRDRRIEGEAQEVADLIKAMVEQKRWSELKALLNAPVSEPAAK
jgi:hypothetical protein